MAGENYDEELSGDPGEFQSHPKGHRFLVAVAGPAMNIALALILLTTTYMLGVPVAQYLQQPAMIGSVEAGSPADQAGLQTADTIVAIDGESVPTWQEAQLRISIRANQRLLLFMERQGKVFEQEITTSVMEGFEAGTIGSSSRKMSRR